jgi:hypothetical protein
LKKPLSIKQEKKFGTKKRRHADITFDEELNEVMNSEDGEENEANKGKRLKEQLNVM